MPKAVALTQIEELQGENEFLQEAKAVSDADLKQLLKIMGEKGEKNDSRCEEMRKITWEKHERIDELLKKNESLEIEKIKALKDIECLEAEKKERRGDYW